MPSGLHRWSRTASSNSTADSSINWAEGQAPSTVNDSSRAEMARIAEYRDDTSGVTSTGGSANTYTFASYQTLTALVDGYKITFTCNATNTGASTINVDSMGAKPLRALTGVALAASAMTTGSIYSATYDSGADEWLLHNYHNNFTSLASLQSAGHVFPAATAMLFQQTAAPTGWTKSTTHNDKALRVVTGTASSGGSVDFSTLFARTATDSYTLLVADVPSLTAPFTYNLGDSGTSVGGPQDVVELIAAGSGFDVNVSVGTTGGGGGHTHPLDMRVKYVDLILATKDA